MNEKYLHFLWRNKRLTTIHLQTTEGEQLVIKKFGDYNIDSGPDFFNGSIQLGHMEFHGNIEMHVNSSDWMKHGHQHDAAYNNVILHVVYNHDQEIYVKDAALPTLELKNLIDWKHFNESITKLNFDHKIPCDKQLYGVSIDAVNAQLKRNTHERLQRKSIELENLFSALNLSIHELLFYAIFKAFGGKLNALPFIELANRIPVYHFLRSSVEIRESILLGASGFLDNTFSNEYELLLKSDWAFQKHRLKLSELESTSLKFKGSRPATFPALRMVQFARFSDQFDWSYHFWSEEPAEILKFFKKALIADTHPYWKEHYHLGLKKRISNSGNLSLNSAENIVINAVVPFLFWYGQKHGNIALLNKAVELLELIPQEKNKIIDRWQKMISYPNNARFGQAVLELNNQWCLHKKCLNCVIGKEVLNFGSQS